MGGVTSESAEDFIKGIIVTKPGSELRSCLRDPIPEIYEAAFLLDQAVVAHRSGEQTLAANLFRRTNSSKIREWTESLWGEKSPYVKYRAAPGSPGSVPKEQRIEIRMPTRVQELELQGRDGFHCRFCGIPLIRQEVREYFHAAYPKEVPWGKFNPTQHSAFQAMWLQYDHLLPHSRGGNNELFNVVITCAPCNYGRGGYSVAEVGLLDPRDRLPVRTSWDGLEKALQPLTGS